MRPCHRSHGSCSPQTAEPCQHMDAMPAGAAEHLPAPERAPRAVQAQTHRLSWRPMLSRWYDAQLRNLCPMPYLQASLVTGLKPCTAVCLASTMAGRASTQSDLIRHALSALDGINIRCMHAVIHRQLYHTGLQRLSLAHMHHGCKRTA